MSNVKHVTITGTVPFDLGQNEDLLKMVGGIHTPSFGLTLSYGKKVESVRNEHRGETAMYEFGLYGQEAMSFDFLERFITLVKIVGGTIARTDVFDLEA